MPGVRNGMMRTDPLCRASPVGRFAAAAIAVSPWRGEYPTDPSNPTMSFPALLDDAEAFLPLVAGSLSPSAFVVMRPRALPPTMMSPAQSLSPCHPKPQLADR